MTPPPAATAAGHRRTTSRSRVAPRAPRRVSGPARRKVDPRTAVRPTAATAVAGAGGLALPRPALRPARPRRAVRAVRRLPDAPLLDRLISGRFWIGMVAFGLIGIVFMQVSLLKLNSGIGRAVEHAQTLERQNASLRASLAGLSSDDRIAQVATGLGMVTPDADTFHYIDAGGVDAKRAARSIAPPKPGVMTASTITPQTGGIGGTAAAAAAQAGALTTPGSTTSTTTSTGAPATATTATAPPAAATTSGQAGPAQQTQAQQAPIQQSQTQSQTQTQAPADSQGPATTQTSTATTAGGVSAAPGAGR